MITKEEIHEWLNKDEGEKYDILQSKGGIEGLGDLLDTNLETGLSGDSGDLSQRKSTCVPLCFYPPPHCAASVRVSVRWGCLPSMCRLR